LNDIESLQELPTGPAAAAFVAAGIGSFALGLLTTISAAVPVVNHWLNWWNSVGPLTGESAIPMIVWAFSWIILHRGWRSKNISFQKAWRISLVLILLGILGTFPIFHE